jgi:3-oxoacyl-[acyl-carrier-protein] synthase II
MLFHEEQIITAYTKKLDWVAAGAVPRISPNSVTSYIAMACNIKGPNLAISTACSSGSNAIGHALYLIRAGIIDVCITGGVEAPLTPVTLAAYQNMRSISRRNDEPTKASRPFDKDRDGFVLSEGAGMILLETEEHAMNRGAKIYAELAGFASNCGAYNMVIPQPDGNDAAAAMRSALKDAGMKPDDIDYINAHGTSTPYNDLAETKAIKTVFGDRAYKTPISSTKSMIGHTIGASGGIEAVVSSLVIQKQMIPPTINLDNNDPECDLDYVPHKSRKADIRNVMSNSFGFGSNNAVLLMKKYKTR